MDDDIVPFWHRIVFVSYNLKMKIIYIKHTDNLYMYVPKYVHLQVWKEHPRNRGSICSKQEWIMEALLINVWNKQAKTKDGYEVEDSQGTYLD